MPSMEEIASEKERLYESSSLRDDLNDSEATVLLKWGEKQVERLAQEFPEEFEQKARFMRQLLKGINRFVGQREFNEMDGQSKYMKKVAMYLEPLGWSGINAEDLFAVLPEDKSDMATNLDAILAVLSPETVAGEVLGDIPDFPEPAENPAQPLENLNPHSITQTDIENLATMERDYDEEETE